MSTNYRSVFRDVQLSEATEARRQFHCQFCTNQLATVTVLKAGATAFTASTSSVAISSDLLGILTVVAADIDTAGPVAFRVEGPGSMVDYIDGLRVVSHDPISSIDAIQTNVDAVLVDTGTSGVLLATNAITSDRLSNYLHHYGGYQIQASEAVTARRTLLCRVHTAGTQTVTVKKNAGTFGACSAETTVSQVDGTIYNVQIGADDCDTTGELALRIESTGGYAYIGGIEVVSHDPHTDLNKLTRRDVSGLVEYDRSTAVMKVYDGATNTATLLQTVTGSTVGTTTYWTPS